MDDKLNSLLAKIRQLEHEVLDEISEKEKKLGYEVKDRKVRFQVAVKLQHQKIAKSLGRYLRDAKIFSIITAPVIWFCIFPVIFLHAVASVYQAICFPVYGIPKVRREDYIVMDRRRLLYLNSMERINCVYCEYVNGLLAYVQEIAGRTEQYWCQIKHAINLKARHSRYTHFLDFGDAEQYRTRLETVRRDFKDLKADSTVN
jgi:hypothetical protein